jgi:hypothetical protein
MSKNLNKKSESVIKANSTKKTGTKKQYRNRNTYPLTNENSNIFNFANDTTSESYNSSNSSDLNDDESDDDAETVITDYASNPYGLTTPPRVNSPVNEMDVDDNDEPPATELLTRHGKKMFYKINDKMEAVTNDNYNRDNPVYDENGNEIPRGEHLPEKRIFMNDIMDESTGGKKKRKTRRKTMRKTIRKTKRKKTRRNKRRHTRKYK